MTNYINNSLKNTKHNLIQIVMDSLPYGIIITDIDLRVQSLNTWLFNHLEIPDGWEGRILDEVFPDLAKRNILSVYQMVIQNGMQMTLSNRIHRYFLKTTMNDSQEFMPQSTVISTLLDGDQIIGTITLITDVTNRVLVEQELEEEVNKLQAMHNIDKDIASLDLDRCLDSIVNHSIDLFPAEVTTVYLYEKGRFRTGMRNSNLSKEKAGKKFNDKFANYIRERNGAVLISDIREHEMKEADDQQYFSIMAAPLIVEDKFLGVLEAQAEKANVFNEDNLLTLDKLAGKAAIAIYNAQLHASERDQRHVTEALVDVSLSLTSLLDRESVIGSLLDNINRLISFDVASISLFEKGDLNLVGVRELGTDLNQIVNEPVSIPKALKSLIEVIDKTHKTVCILDSKELADWDIENQYEDYRSWVGTPIIVREKLIGFIVLRKKRANQYNYGMLASIEAFAAIAGIAIENARLYDQQQLLADTDGLTGLANRRKFDEILKLEYRRNRRANRTLSLALLDIDKFKNYNDTYGHPVGDDLLRNLGSLLKSMVREVDFVARYGGEKFVIILPETSLRNAEMVMDRLRKKVTLLHIQSQSSELPLPDFAVTVSIGISSVSGEEKSASELLEEADVALYQAKEGGRNQVRRYHPK
ncbi:MAG: diguanylate cyclase [Anaerolineaceae bacterium]|nr:diguanylate cyclase [Anaerolineaceae bacterium]